MEPLKRAYARLPRYLVAWIWSGLLLVQVALALFALDHPRDLWLMGTGWAIWALGTVFAIWPIFALRNRGAVPDGKSYMQTTALVDTGIYAVVRHPQGGTAGILMNLALVLIGQHWLVAVLAAVGIPLLYVDTYAADASCVAKFGEAYERYMERVPSVNFVSGLLRLLARARTEAA